MIEAYVEFDMIPPYASSLNTVYEMVSLWGMRIIRSNPAVSTVVLAIPSDKFKLFFGELPRPGEWKVPSGTQSFLSGARVIKVRPANDETKRDRHDKNSKTEKN